MRGETLSEIRLRVSKWDVMLLVQRLHLKAVVQFQ